jgi:hypothetical protein
MPACLACLTAVASGFSSRGGSQITSTFWAMQDWTSATCLAADPAALV